MRLFRVTEVLSLLFPGSLDFVQDEHLENGRYLHEQVEVALNNMIMGLADTATGSFQPQGTLITETEARVLAVLEWIDAVGFIPEQCEGEYTHRHGYVGHPDCIGYIGTKSITLDWKFSEGIILQNECQAEAYRQATGNPTWLVQCNREAKITVKKCKPNPRLWAAFCSALNVLKFRATHKPEPLSEEVIHQQAQAIKEAFS